MFLYVLREINLANTPVATKKKPKPPKSNLISIRKGKTKTKRTDRTPNSTIDNSVYASNNAAICLSALMFFILTVLTFGLKCLLKKPKSLNCLLGLAEPAKKPLQNKQSLLPKPTTPKVPDSNRSKFVVVKTAATTFTGSVLACPTFILFFMEFLLVDLYKYVRLG